MKITPFKNFMIHFRPTIRKWKKTVKQQQMLKIFVSKNVKISYLQLFYWGIKIYANTLFSTSSTSKDNFVYSIENRSFYANITVESGAHWVSILFIYANIFLTLDFFTAVSGGQNQIYWQNCVQQFQEDASCTIYLSIHK